MKKHSIARMWAALLVAGSASTLTGCAHNLTVIHYSQPDNAFLFDSDPTGSPHDTSSADNGIFAFYCITGIENTDTNATQFNFQLSKLYVSGDAGNIPGNVSFSNLVQTAPSTKTVAPHSSTAKLGRFVIYVQGNGGPTDLKNAMLNLNYNSTGSESVVVVRDGGSNPPAVKFLDPASPVHPNNLPSCE